MRSPARLVPVALLLGLSACRTPNPNVPRAEEVEMPELAAAQPSPASGPTPSALPPSAQAPSARLAVQPVVLFDGFVKVGIHTSYVHCEGPGEDRASPVVVFDAGFGDSGKAWTAVLPEVARFTRACTYDRLGLGGSSAAPLRNSVPQLVGQLRAVLEQVLPREMLVLVGHSLGGLTTRLYATEYPAEVAGLVLVDAATEGAAEMWSLLPPEQLKQFRAMWDRGAEHLDLDAFRGGLAEAERVTSAAGEEPLGARPLVVLTGARATAAEVTPEVETKMRELWLGSQAALLRLSSNSVQIVTQESGHYIHVEQPDLVVAAVREVLRASRSASRVQSDL